MKRIIIQSLALILLLMGSQWSAVNGQRKVRLDLDRTISLATDSSYTAQKYQSVYDASLFSYLSWEASRKVQISLESTPLQYERYMTKRYVSEEDIDIYRKQQMLYAQAGIHAEQPIEWLGGTLYGSTELGYLRTFGSAASTQFMTVPISVGYKQELLGFNSLKWNKRIEPLKLALAEKQLAYDTERSSVEAVEKFFALALAQDQLRMSEEYIASCDTTTLSQKNVIELPVSQKQNLVFWSWRKPMHVIRWPTHALPDKEPCRNWLHTWVWIGILI